MNSMTAFGRGSVTAADRRVTVELRAVNHRFRDFAIRLPKHMLALDEPIRRRLNACIERGRIDVNVVVEPAAGALPAIDLERARAFAAALATLRAQLQLDERVRLDHILMLPDLFRSDEAPDDPETLWAEVAPAFEQALEALLAMRRQEGQALRRDLLALAERLAEQTRTIKAHATDAVARYRERLARRLAELSPDAGVDEQRLAAEVVLFADRIDIHEELVRFDSHLDQFRATVTGASGEPCGRKLEFLLQEMHREINTIGSKAQSTVIANAVVECKTLLEKCREQAQNVE